MTVLDVHTALIVEIGPNGPRTATDSLIQFRHAGVRPSSP